MLHIYIYICNCIHNIHIHNHHIRVMNYAQSHAKPILHFLKGIILRRWIEKATTCLFRVTGLVSILSPMSWRLSWSQKDIVHKVLVNGELVRSTVTPATPPSLWISPDPAVGKLGGGSRRVVGRLLSATVTG